MRCYRDCMRQRTVLFLLPAMLASTAFADVACIPPTSRELLNGSRLVAVATGTADHGFDVQHVLYGTSKQSHFDARRERLNTCGWPEAGETYLLVLNCGLWRPDDCGLSMRKYDQAADDLAFVRNRHFTTRAELLAHMRRWIGGEQSTKAFHEWIRNADTPESYGSGSVTAHLLGQIEDLADELEALNTLAPQQAAAVLLRMPMLLRRLEELPNEEAMNVRVSAVLETFFATPEWAAASATLRKSWDEKAGLRE